MNVTAKNWANGLGMDGRDGRRKFSTQDLGSRGIAVRIDGRSEVVHYEVVTGTANHFSAYEIALNHYLAAKRVS